MAIPGWTNALFTLPSLHPLPTAEVIEYKDTYRFGQASALITHTVGEPLIENLSGYRRLHIRMEIRNVFDTLLLDRIE